MRINLPKATAPVALSGGPQSGNMTPEWYRSLSLAFQQIQDEIDASVDNAELLAHLQLQLSQIILLLGPLSVVSGTGFLTKDGNVYNLRQILGTTNRIAVANSDGSGGDVSIDIDAAYVGQASITTLGTITTGTWNATTIGPTFGGTGQTTVTTGDLLYGSATNVWSKRAIGSTNQVLIITAGLPTWGQVSLTAGVTGVLPAPNGGTGQSTYAVGDILYASSTTALSKLPIGTSGQVLGITGGLPAWMAGGGTGTVTSITAGTGLSATPSNPITTSGTLAIANTGITAGTYGDARHVTQITFNAQGQATAAVLKNVCPYDSVGLISGGQLSINAGNAALFDMAAGVVLYEDYTSVSEPEQKLVPFGPFTGVSIPGIGTRLATYVAIDSTGGIQQLADPITPTQRRTMAQIGALIHSNLTIINTTNDIAQAVRSTGNQVQDFADAVGPLNRTGNVFSANGANLMMNKSAGTLWKQGCNFQTNPLDPNNVALGSLTALTFRYRTSTGTEGSNVTSIDPNTYESSPGVLSAVPALINTWHVQRVNIFQSGIVRVQYAQNVYPSQAAAQAAINTENFATETNIAENGVLRCYLVINRGILNLNTSATFINVAKFGGQVSGSGSVTSVGLAMPAQFTVTNSPVTSSGTLTAAWNTQTANTVLAGPSSGAAAVPTFRSLTVADVTLPTDYISGLKMIWNSATSISVSTGEAVIPSTVRTEVVSSTLTLSGLSLSVSTFYHIYLFDTAGTPTIECVTTAPASPYQGTARAKTGDTTRRYVGSVRTDSSGNVIRFIHQSYTGDVKYEVDINNAQLFILNGGTATTTTTVSATSCVPTTSRIMTGFLENQGTTGIAFISNGDLPAPANSNILAFLRPVSAAGMAGALFGEILLTSVQTFTYLVTGTSSLTCWCTGYKYER